MERRRLTAKMFLANSYESLLNKLKKEYPELLQEARIYKGGESGGFVFHHLNFRTDNMLPTTNYNGNKIEQSKYLRKLLDYNKLRTNSQKQAFILENLPHEHDDFEKIDARLESEKKQLDKEIKGVALIPKDFHGYLHSSKGSKLPHARNTSELYQQFMIYRESLTVDKMLKLLENSRGSVTNGIDAIKRVTNYLLYNKRGKEAEHAVDTAIIVLDGILRNNQL